MDPLKMKPAFKDYLWGGTRLKEQYGKETALDVVAESWEVSCHPDGPSLVDGGPCDGETLQAVLEKYPAYLGTKCRDGIFPLLIKLIDADKSLSIQVHPDTVYAQREEHQLGKNEMWYVVDAAPGAQLILGTERPMVQDALRAAIDDGTITDVVRTIPVKMGDCFSIPAGLIHAIGEGLLVAEIQQNSNVTYRVWDYGRLGTDGEPRELHIEKALDVIDTTLRVENATAGAPEKRLGFSHQKLTNWRYFTVELLDIQLMAALTCTAESFQCILVTEGVTTLVWYNGEMTLTKGQSAFVPAGLGGFTLKGKAKILLTYL